MGLPPRREIKGDLMRMLLRILLAPIVLLLAGGAAFAQSASPNSELPALQRFGPDQVNKAIDPCDDFFEYACSKWISENPIPPDQSAWSSFGALALWNVAALHSVLEEAQAAKNPSPVEKKAGDYYASCMDEAAVDKAGLAPLQVALDRIARLSSNADLPELLAFLHQIIRPANLNFIDAQYPGILFGVFGSPDFDDAASMILAIDQSGMGLPAREFYQNDDEKSKLIREEYVSFVATLLKLGGAKEQKSQSDARAILAMESALASSAMDIVARRDPKNQSNKMSLSELQALTPSFSWKRYFQALGLPPQERYLVLAPDFLKGVEKLLASETTDHVRVYLRYSLLRLHSSELSQPFAEASFGFLEKTLNGAKEMQPRWRRCARWADMDLGEAVGQVYVAKFFPAESKARIRALVKGVEQALHADIDAQGWMSAETKMLAHRKLDAQVDKIGYPDKWIDYSGLDVRRNDFLGNVERAAGFELHRRLAQVGQKVDRGHWGMTPPTVNAYEDPQTNTINFPAGILQPPFFDPSAPEALNYGGIGVVIGHEIIHGYDDQGRKFDALGNLRNWWTPDEAQDYEKRDSCITDEYTADIPEAGVKQNGKLSAGEDTADNGGIHIALAALENALKAEGKTLDDQGPFGLTQLQAFFLSDAKIWCGSLRPEAARTRVLTQGHSLPRYRVNNVLGNMAEFAHAFSCHAGQPMVHANACRVW